MKRIVFVSAMVLGFVMSANMVFGNLYVIATRPQVAGKEITSVPYNISSPGFCYITRGLCFPVGEVHVGIEITADNVPLNLMGCYIHGESQSGTTGLYINNADLFEIRNGVVRHFAEGILGITNADKYRLLNMCIFEKNGHGIIIQGTNHAFRECLVAGNHYGIEI